MVIFFGKFTKMSQINSVITRICLKSLKLLNYFYGQKCPFYGCDKKMYITKLPFKFWKIFRRHIYLTEKKIYRDINMLIKSAVEFTSAVYLVADF